MITLSLDCLAASRGSHKTVGILPLCDKPGLSHLAPFPAIFHTGHFLQMRLTPTTMRVSSELVQTSVAREILNKEPQGLSGRYTPRQGGGGDF